MVNALSKLRNKIREEGADGSLPIKEEVQVPVQPAKESAVVNVETRDDEEVVVEETLAVKETVIHTNQPRIYEQGYSVEIIAQEFAIIIKNEMIKQNLSSISADAFGVFHSLGISYPDFKLVEDKHTGKLFYLLRDFDKSSDNKKLLKDLAEKHKAKVLSIGYTRDIKLNLPLNLTNNIEPDQIEYRELRAESLVFTAEEISKMEYSFLEKFSFYNNEGKDWLLIYFNLENLAISENML